MYQKRPRPLAIAASTPPLYLEDEVEELEDVHDDSPGHVEGVDDHRSGRVQRVARPSSDSDLWGGGAKGIQKPAGFRPKSRFLMKVPLARSPSNSKGAMAKGRSHALLQLRPRGPMYITPLNPPVKGSGDQRTFNATLDGLPKGRGRGKDPPRGR